MNINVGTEYELKTQVEAYRKRDPKKIKLKIRLALDGEKVSKAEIDRMNANKLQLLKNMEIEDIIGVDDIEITTRQEMNADTVKRDLEGYDPANIAVVDTVNSGYKREDLPENIIYMQYQNVATAKMFDTVIQVMAHEGDITGIAKGLVEKVGNMYIFLPEIEEFDLGVLVKEIERYREVLIRA